MSTSSPLATLGNIFVAPAQAFDDVRNHNGWLWWPLLIMIAATAAFTGWYLASVDIHWLTLQSLQQNPMVTSHMNADQIQQIADNATRTSALVGGVIGSILGFPIIYAIAALYYLLAAKVAGYDVSGYGSWYSFVSWSNFPAVISVLVSALVYLVRGNHQVLAQDLDLTALNALLFHLSPGNSWYTLVSSLRLTTFWVIGLSIFGLSRWTRRGMGHSAFVVLLPYVVIYGIWILAKVI